MGKALLNQTIKIWFTLCLPFSLSSCVTPEEEGGGTGLDEASVRELIPNKVKDRPAWAADIIAALDAIPKVPTPERVCAVIAVIEQESGFAVDPQIPDLPRIVRAGLKEKFSSLGPLADSAVAALLAGRAPGAAQSFEERVAKLRSERDLDRLFRDLAAAYRGKLPGTFVVASAISLLLGKGSLYDLNPVTTAGSMQVKVSFARELKGVPPREDGPVREELYTRAGGIRYGTARLLDYPASYTDVKFRFADYNAGRYSSRNAAFQARLSDLGESKLVLDGDLLAYDQDGDSLDIETKSLKALLAFGLRHELSESRIRRDAKKEKDLDFESTESWEAVNAAWETKMQKKIIYARIPELEIRSPKLSRTRSTAWFADSVAKRYSQCRARVGAAAENLSRN